jgi:hypothetical protein
VPRTALYILADLKCRARSAPLASKRISMRLPDNLWHLARATLPRIARRKFETVGQIS